MLSSIVDHLQWSGSPESAFGTQPTCVDVWCDLLAPAEVVVPSLDLFVLEEALVLASEELLYAIPSVYSI